MVNYLSSHPASSWWSQELNPGQVPELSAVSHVTVLPSAGQAVDLGDGGEFGGKVGESGLEALAWGRRASVLQTTWRDGSQPLLHSSSEVMDLNSFPRKWNPLRPPPSLACAPTQTM